MRRKCIGAKFTTESVDAVLCTEFPISKFYNFQTFGDLILENWRFRAGRGVVGEHFQCCEGTL